MLVEKKIFLPSKIAEVPFNLTKQFSILTPPKCPTHFGGTSLLELPSIEMPVIASNKPTKGGITTNEDEEIHPLEILPLVVDKVSLVMDIRPEDREEIKGYFWEIRMEDKQNGSLHTSYAKRGMYDFAFNYRLDSQLVKNFGNLLIQVDPKSLKRPFLRFEFNPNTVGISGVKKARKFFEETFDFINTHGDYPDINNKISITRLDLAVDISGASMEDLLFYKPGLHQWEVYKEYRLDGKSYIQTQYLGASKSETKFCIYDKKAQLKKIGKGVLFKETTRIEHRSSKSTPLASIHEIKNPFTKLKILDARLVEAGNRSNQMYCFFIDSVHRRGPTGALKVIKDKKTRASYRKKLEDKAKVDWWNPDKIFEGLPKALEKAGLSPFEG